MTSTYFIRHSSALDLDKETLDALWSEDRIAIHFPHDEIGDIEEGDSRSLDPADYSGSGKKALKAILKLARDGGYVFATYRGRAGGKVGYVPPQSSVELISGKWGAKYNRKGREAVLKTLQLKNARNLAAEEAISLTAVQPRQGAICQWRRIGKRVASIVSGSPATDLGSLTPDLQEVMCMEYLRTDMARKRGLPVLRHTLMPVGRTMKDIDVLGIAESGKVLSAQVTFKTLKPAGRKLQKLDPYRRQGNDTVYFCDCKSMQEINGHIIFPLGLVFDDFCVKSQEGKEWLRVATGG